jgi:prevent-host-death family protein
MRVIAQRELRNRSAEVLRDAEAGAEFTITVGGRPVAVLGPQPRKQWIAKNELLTLLRSLPADPRLIEDVADLGGTLADLDDPWQR